MQHIYNKNSIKMKRFLLLLVVSVFTIGFSSCEKQTILENKEIPEPIKVFIDEHFPGIKVEIASKNEEGLSVEYVIVLSGNIHLEFDKKYKIKEMEFSQGLPDSVIPDPILDYVKANYPKNFIVSWEREKNRQYVELDNDVELVFDDNGEFIKVDF